MMQMLAYMGSITPHGSGHRNFQLQYSDHTYSLCCGVLPDTPLVWYPSFLWRLSGTPINGNCGLSSTVFSIRPRLWNPIHKGTLSSSESHLSGSKDLYITRSNAALLHPSILALPIRLHAGNLLVWTYSTSLEAEQPPGLILEAEVVPKWLRGTGSRTKIKQEKARRSGDTRTQLLNPQISPPNGYCHRMPLRPYGHKSTRYLSRPLRGFLAALHLQLVHPLILLMEPLETLRHGPLGETGMAWEKMEIKEMEDWMVDWKLMMPRKFGLVSRQAYPHMIPISRVQYPTLQA
jgi:hypothetical protein